MTHNAKPVYLRRLLWCAIALAAVCGAAWAWLQWRGTQPYSPLAHVSFDTTSLRNGDLIFRNGLGSESLVVTASSGGDYSHVGILYNDGSGWQVIHAVPGENTPGEPEWLKCEPIEDFFSPHRAQAGAVARVNCDDATAAQAAIMALRKVKAGVTFDNDYNINDTTTLYCSELVWQAYMSQGINLAPENTTTPILFPEHLWTSPKLQSHQVFNR